MMAKFLCPIPCALHLCRHARRGVAFARTSMPALSRSRCGCNRSATGWADLLLPAKKRPMRMAVGTVETLPRSCSGSDFTGNMGMLSMPFFVGQSKKSPTSTCPRKMAANERNGPAAALLQHALSCCGLPGPHPPKKTL